MTAYATLAEFKSVHGITDTTDDLLIQDVLEAVSRAVDGFCGWRFYTTSSDETRVYTAESSGHLTVPEGLISLTSLKTDTTGDGTFDRTWSSTDYELWPYNASLDGGPYLEIEVALASDSNDYTFPRIQRGVQVVGKFGYAKSAPRPIQHVTLHEAGIAWKGVVHPHGVASGIGSEKPEWAMLTPLSRQMLTPYRRPGAVSV